MDVFVTGATDRSVALGSGEARVPDQSTSTWRSLKVGDKEIVVCGGEKPFAAVGDVRIIPGEPGPHPHLPLPTPDPVERHRNHGYLR